MPAIYPIVEGYGDVEAVPILLRRILSEFLQTPDVAVLRPFRLARNKVTSAPELARALRLAELKLAEHSPPVLRLVLMDADDDCPVKLIEQIREQQGPHLHAPPTSIVFDVREFEAWFLASGVSKDDHHSLREGIGPIADPEAIRDAKGRFQREVMAPNARYSEAVDQPKYASTFRLERARANSPSFDKLVRDIEGFAGGIDVRR